MHVEIWLRPGRAMAGLSTRLRRPCRYDWAALQHVSITTTPALLLRQKNRTDKPGKAHVSGGDRMNISIKIGATQYSRNAQDPASNSSTAAGAELWKPWTRFSAAVACWVSLVRIFHILTLQSLCP